MSVLSSVDLLRQQLEAAVIGQEALVNRLLIALLVDGHLLVEGAPGLAKTRAIKALADNIEANYQRVQFTPDLLPADLTGTEIYRPADGSFTFQPGPLFNNLILADEINRAPAKVQSALLEAMAEQQISVSHVTYALPVPFMVMATQNPIEQEGTYPLPEAQLDRFLMKVQIGYPDAEREVDILRLVRNEAIAASAANTVVGTKPGQVASSQQGGRAVQAVKESPGNVQLTLQELLAARSEVLSVHMADNVEDYIVRLVTASRSSNSHDSELERWLSYGASPRGTLSLDASARAHAWLDGRDYVSPGDVQAVVHDVLRHRLLLSYEAEADGITADDAIDRLLQLIVVA
ncbi:MAG: AAA family ATPase [Granulosicoccus sp.]